MSHVHASDVQPPAHSGRAPELGPVRWRARASGTGTDEVGRGAPRRVLLVIRLQADRSGTPAVRVAPGGTSSWVLPAP